LNDFSTIDPKIKNNQLITQDSNHHNNNSNNVFQETMKREIKNIIGYVKLIEEKII